MVLVLPCSQVCSLLNLSYSIPSSIDDDVRLSIKLRCRFRDDAFYLLLEFGLAYIFIHMQIIPSQTSTSRWSFCDQSDPIRPLFELWRLVEKLSAPINHSIRPFPVLIRSRTHAAQLCNMNVFSP